MEIFREARLGGGDSNWRIPGALTARLQLPVEILVTSEIVSLFYKFHFYTYLD
jgi:hypothetical protein